jgi:hypothetical protein
MIDNPEHEKQMLMLDGVTHRANEFVRSITEFVSKYENGVCEQSAQSLVGEMYRKLKAVKNSIVASGPKFFIVQNDTESDGITAKTYEYNHLSEQENCFAYVPEGLPNISEQMLIKQLSHTFEYLFRDLVDKLMSLSDRDGPIDVDEMYIGSRKLIELVKFINGFWGDTYCIYVRCESFDMDHVSYVVTIGE